jgi:predicted nucleic acid-binding protein
LIEAKSKNLVQAIRPHMDVLRTQAGFRISAQLYDRVLNDAGER